MTMDESDFVDEDVYDEDDDLYRSSGSAGEFDDYDEDGQDMEDDDLELMSGDEDELADLKTASRPMRAYETAFKVLSASDLNHRQQDMSSRVSTLLGIPLWQSFLLLEAFKWHNESLVERYLEDTDKARALAGLPADIQHSSGSTKTRAVNGTPRGFMCFICCREANETPDMKTFGLECQHYACSQCYGYYLSQKIREEGESKSLACPGEKCGLLVDELSVKALVDEETYSKYKSLLNKEFVKNSQLLKWCPAPSCEYAIECMVRKTDLDTHVPIVNCLCGQAFCFGCGMDDHLPCTCTLAKKWVQKCEDDSETSHWISAHTKDCPKCQSRIEKNGGCNHMTCKSCRNEFCWVCMGDWVSHGSAYYNCSRFDDKESKNARNAQEKSRAELERYLHYYNRYANHRQSSKLDKATFVRVERKMKELQENSGMSWIEVQFINQTFETLQASRSTLVWTYAFAFYLQKNHTTTIFEDNQRDLELATEQLSEIFEQPATDLANQKVLLLDKCAYVTNRRSILLEHACQGLAAGTWEYIVSV